MVDGEPTGFGGKLSNAARAAGLWAKFPPPAAPTLAKTCTPAYQAQNAPASRVHLPHYSPSRLMNQKRTFGSLLTLLGIAGIIYGALGLIGMVALSKVNSFVPLGVGLIFFFAGISLVRATGDRA